MEKLLAALSALLVVVAATVGVLPAAASNANLIPNPSVEIAAGSTPSGWYATHTGTNTPLFTYLKGSGHTGTRSVQAAVTKYTSGDAEWMFNAVTVSPLTSYTYTDWYKASVASNVAVRYTDAKGNLTWVTLGAAPAAAAWAQTQFTFTTPANVKKLVVAHRLSRVGSVTVDDVGLVSNGATTPATAPTVSISTPVANASVSASTAVTAAAAPTDTSVIVSVQFQMDGKNLGMPVTASPYVYQWDTTTAANGSHSLAAVATTSAGKSATSLPVAVTVVNPVPPPPQGSNLIANSSFETASGAAPAGWSPIKWGTNNTTFSYLKTGHTGGRSVEVQMTKFTSGAAEWYYGDIPVTVGNTYKYTNWYKSNVDTEVYAEIVANDGTTQYALLGKVFASPDWTSYTTSFTVPAGTGSVSIYQVLDRVGYVVTDDYSLSEYTPSPFNRPIVSVSFDDGWANQYVNALPLLQEDGINATFNIISGQLDGPATMSSAQVQSLYSMGYEIASHSVSHPDLTTVSPSQLTTEMAQSQATLQALIGAPVTDFAYPYGAYSASTLAVGGQYYASQRSVNLGLNTKDNLDLTQLKVFEVDADVPVAEVDAWVDQAIAQKSWLILLYHETATSPAAPGDSAYTTQPADLSAELSYLESTGVTTETVHQAIAEVESQQ